MSRRHLNNIDFLIVEKILESRHIQNDLEEDGHHPQSVQIGSSRNSIWPPFKRVLSGPWKFAITILKMRSSGGCGVVRISLHGVPLTAGFVRADYDDILTDFTYASVNI
jgi:hypothetical protein